MEKIKLFLIAITLFCLEINGLANPTEQSIAYQGQAAFKISVYKKDVNDPEKPIFCDELLMNDMTKNILITCHKNNKIEYSLFQHPITERRVRDAQGSVFSRRTIFCLRQDPLGMALTRFKYVKAEKRYIKQLYPSQPNSNDVDAVTFTRDNFILKLQEIPIKVPVQETAEKK
jgi:hypothetical protein